MEVVAKTDSVLALNDALDAANQAERRSSTRYSPRSTSASLHMQLDSVILAQGAQIALKYGGETTPSSSASRLRVNSAISAVLLMAIGKLPLVIALADSAQRKAAFRDWLDETLRAAIIAGLTDTVVAAIRPACETVWPLIKDAKQASCNAGVAAAVEAAFKALSLGTHGATTVASAAWTITMDTLRTIYHGAAWLSANFGVRDDIAKARHADHLRQILSLDHLAKNLFVLLVPPAIAGAVGMTGVLPSAVFSIFAGSVYDSILASKAKCRTWTTYFRTLVFGADERIIEWDSPLFDLVEGNITDELRCVITHNIVVNPLRSKFNGRIYERGAILRWIRARGRDPLTDDLATEADYVGAPVAASSARRYAELLDAEEVFVRDP